MLYLNVNIGYGLCNVELSAVVLSIYMRKFDHKLEYVLIIWNENLIIIFKVHKKDVKC